MLAATKKVGVLANDFDLVFVYQLSPILMGIPGIKYAKKHNVPMVIYCCDLWPESIKMYIRDEDNVIFKVVKRISTVIYNSAQKVIVQSTSFLSYLKRVHGIADKKLSYIPAFADETYLTQNFTPENDIVDFVFLGNLGIAQNLLVVLEAVERIKTLPGFKVHFVGDGSMLDEMKRFVSEHNLEDVVFFYGRRPVTEMPTFYKLADACLVSLKADNETGLTLPSKVQGYMAAGKPIIGMIDGSAKDVIEESGCGLCVKAGDVEGFANAMKRFITAREDFRECGQKARLYFTENFSKEKFMKKLEEEFERILI